MNSTPEYTKEQLSGLRLAYRDNSLVAVLAQYNLTLPRNAHEWRVPVVPEAGYIRGITTTSVRLLCTDGILGWFAWDDGQVLLGHIQFWEPLKEAKAAERKERVSKLAKLVDEIGD